jgi:hypothetical protein
MNKTILFVLLLTVALSSNPETPRLGGYEVVEPSQINDATEYTTIVEIINFAKNAY